MRYAQPPINNLRLANTVPYKGNPLVKANRYGKGCLQLDDFAECSGLGEDYLALNVIRPSGTNAAHNKHAGNGIPRHSVALSNSARLLTNALDTM